MRLPADAFHLLGAEKGIVMRPKKLCYGQIGAPRRWWQEADRRLRALSFTPKRLDPCMHCAYQEDGTLCGIRKNIAAHNHCAVISDEC